MAKQLSFIIFSIIFCSAAIALPVSGNSAWLYGKNNDWLKQIAACNAHTAPSHNFNYLFPKAGVVQVNSKDNKLIIQYDPTVTQFYKHALPTIKILANMSFWVAKSNFKNWAAANYQQAADQLANIINHDPNADGVFLDLEIYQDTLLPFYKTLRASLKPQKMLAVIVRPASANVAWFSALGKNSFVVLYGYDLQKPTDSALPVSPTQYQQRLAAAIDKIMHTAQISQTPVMLGVPAIATSREWEWKIPDLKNPQQIIKSTYRQADYFTAAMALANAIQSPYYLGVSLWAFVADTTNQSFWPLTISQNEWEQLCLYKLGLS